MNNKNSEISRFNKNTQIKYLSISLTSIALVVFLGIKILNHQIHKKNIQTQTQLNEYLIEDSYFDANYELYSWADQL
jgi:hypothetical protein